MEALKKDGVRAGPLSSREWLEHFKESEEPEDLPGGGPGLTEAEREAVIPSVQEFQLGENSEGKNLHRRAKEYAEENEDPDYLLAIEYFIREEQRHARYLRDFLASEGFGTVKKRWVDNIFRKLRNLAGLEVSVAVLVTAEILAKVYYAALHGATRSPMLRAICARVLRDEEAHVHFQAERLAILRRGRPKSGMVLTNLLHRALFFGAAIVVWRNHGPAIRRGGFGFGRYWRSCWQEYETSAEIMNPGRYGQPG